MSNNLIFNWIIICIIICIIIFIRHFKKLTRKYKNLTKICGKIYIGEIIYNNNKIIKIGYTTRDYPSIRLNEYVISKYKKKMCNIQSYKILFYYQNQTEYSEKLFHKKYEKYKYDKIIEIENQTEIYNEHILIEIEKHFDKLDKKSDNCNIELCKNKKTDNLINKNNHIKKDIINVKKKCYNVINENMIIKKGPKNAKTSHINERVHKICNLNIKVKDLLNKNYDTKNLIYGGTRLKKTDYKLKDLKYDIEKSHLLLVIS